MLLTPYGFNVIGAVIILGARLWLAASEFGAVRIATLAAARQQLEASGIGRPLATRRVLLTDERGRAGSPNPARNPG